VGNDEEHPPTDARLIAEVLAGDTERFGQLVDRYKNLVMSYVAARVAATEVDDLAQETFLRAFRVIASLREPAAFSSWLLGIANHVCVDWHRARRRIVSLDGDGPEPAVARLPNRPDPAPPDEAAQREEASRLVLESLDRLPETYRVTLVLKHLDGLSCTDIAERLGVALGTVTSRLARGYKMLRERLDELSETPGLP
jgi:RNA polymerase sigma-70 factor (ECF subfamily)